MNPFNEYVRYETRRQFFARGKNVLGAAALASLLGPKWDALAGGVPTQQPALPHFPPKARRVIYLHMVGGPS